MVYVIGKKTELRTSNKPFVSEDSSEWTSGMSAVSTVPGFGACWAMLRLPLLGQWWKALRGIGVALAVWAAALCSYFRHAPTPLGLGLVVLLQCHAPKP